MKINHPLINMMIQNFFQEIKKSLVTIKNSGLEITVYELFCINNNDSIIYHLICKELNQLGVPKKGQ